MWWIFGSFAFALLTFPKPDGSLINIESPAAYNAHILKVHVDWLLAQGVQLEGVEMVAESPVDSSFLAKLIAMLPQEMADLKLLQSFSDRDLYLAGAYPVLLAMDKATDYGQADRLLKITLGDDSLVPIVRKVSFPHGLDAFLETPPVKLTEGFHQLLKVHARVKAEQEALEVCNREEGVKAALGQPDFLTVFEDCLIRQASNLTLGYLARLPEPLDAPALADQMVKLPADECFHHGVNMCQVVSRRDHAEPPTQYSETSSTFSPLSPSASPSSPSSSPLSPSASPSSPSASPVSPTVEPSKPNSASASTLQRCLLPVILLASLLVY